MSEAAHSPGTEQRFLPRNRESFLDAQRRNRRATWRLSVLCVLAAAVMGIPLALILTPLLYAVALITADIVNIFSPLPPALWAQAEEVARFGMVSLGWLLQQRSADPQALVLGAAVLLLPGMALSLFLWLTMSVLFRRSGVGGALLALKAREPNQNDLKELQLADVIQEMAIAAGLPAPRVMLVDAPGANAAAIGTSSEDARLVVSRRLVDDLSRDELEGVLAHLIASIGNGDLRIAFRLTAIFETYGLLVTMINSPFGPQSRRMLWRVVRYGLGGSAKDGGAKEAAAVADLLTRNVSLDTDDIDRLFDTTAKKSIFRSIRNFLLFPIFFTNAAIKLALWFFSLAMLGPSVALLWRAREYLADASAVQLTRNPDGLAGALQKLNEDAGAIPGGDWASFLFIVQPAHNDRMASDAPSERQKETLARAWAASTKHTSGPPPQPVPSDFSTMLNEFTATQRAAFAGDAQAMTRLRAAAQELAILDPSLAASIPDPADLVAARQGDRAAIARLIAFHRARPSESQAGPRSQEQSSTQSSDISSVSFLPFHPSLKRRLKRLDRMGAHVALDAPKPRMWIVVFVISLIFAPLLLLLIGLFLILIAVMTMASLTFVVLWLAVIHKIFVLVAHH
jgi:Zn-dependent protease with chaperone function